MACSFPSSTNSAPSQSLHEARSLDSAELNETLSMQIPQNIQAQSPSAPSLSIFDMELLHHFVISTCYTLSPAPAVRAIWREEAPRLGFTMPAVLHAILAVSALHLAHSNPSRRVSCISRAHEHHNTAVRIVTPDLPSLTSHNGDEIFLFSALTCIFACANARYERNFLMFFESGHLAEWALLFRGTKTIIDYSEHDFPRGKLGPIFVNGMLLSATRSGEQALEHGLMYVWELKQMISRECSHDDACCEMYQNAVNSLAKILGVVMKPGEGPTLQSADVFVWLLEVSDGYLEQLLQEAPIALIIFGYFCVALRQIECMWWTDGLSGQLMEQLYAVLDEHYQDWLRWPKEQICQNIPGST